LKQFSEAERFEGKLLYVPYKLNGVAVIETTLILNKCSIENTINDEGTKGTYTVCGQDVYRFYGYFDISNFRRIFI